MKIFLHNADTQIGLALFDELKRLNDTGNLVYGTMLSDSEPESTEILSCSEYINIVSKSNPKLVIRTSLQCDLSVIPLMTMSDSEVAALVEALNSRTLSKDIVIVLISSFESWSATPVDVVRPEDYAARIPGTNEGMRFKRIEDEFLAMSNPRVKVKIVTCGRIYGSGEFEFSSIFKHAWQGLPFQAVRGPQIFPLVHAIDVAKITRNFFAAEFGPFAFAVDASALPHSELVSRVFGNFSDTALINWETSGERKIPIFSMPEDFEYFSKEFNVESVCLEFCEKRNCRPRRVLIYGAEFSLAKNLAEFYGLPLLREVCKSRESTFRGFVLTLPNFTVDEARKIFLAEGEEAPTLREEMKPHAVLEISENFQENSDAEAVSQFFRSFKYDVPVLDIARPEIFKVARTFVERLGRPVCFLPPRTQPALAVHAAAQPAEDAENKIINAIEEHEKIKGELAKKDLKKYLTDFCIPAIVDAVGKLSEISTDDPLGFIAQRLDELAREN